MLEICLELLLKEFLQDTLTKRFVCFCHRCVIISSLFVQVLGIQTTFPCAAILIFSMNYLKSSSRFLFFFLAFELLFLRCVRTRTTRDIDQHSAKSLHCYKNEVALFNCSLIQ